MTQPTPELRDLSAVMAALAALPAQLTGKDGKAIREHVEKLAKILGSQGPEAELRGRAAAELEQLVAAIGQLVGRGKAGQRSRQVGGLDLGELAQGLKTFAEFLRAPTDANQADALRLVATLHGTAAPRPVPLDELDISGTVEDLAIEAARRHGLQGAEARRATERMKREMTALVRELERQAQQEASRARTAADMERLLDQVVQTGTALAQALAPERAAIAAAYRRVDLAHMAEGLRVFGEWLSTPADDGAAHVAALRTQLVQVLGPPTAKDPARGEDERRADFERAIKAAVDQIFGGSVGGSGAGPGPAS